MTGVLSDWRVRALAVVLALWSGVACAARGTGFVAPAAGGVPAPDVAAVVAATQQPCAAVRTMTAQGALRGHIGGRRVRGRLDLGLTSEGHVRLEAVAPFGLLFVLAGDADRATLLLTRERRVLRDEPAAEIVEALAGVRLSPGTLLSVVSGCPSGGAPVTGGQRFPDGLLQAIAGPDRTLWARVDSSGPRVVAARIGDLLVEYPALFAGTAPRTVHLRKADTDPSAAVDLQLALSQIELNGPIDPGAFSVTVPADVQAMTLDELRRSGLLERPVIGHAMPVVVRALSKINLHLEVHGRRPDGYHDLTTVFQTIGIGDVITLDAWDGPFVLEGGSDAAPPDSTNLVWRAAQLMATEVGRDLSGVRLVLRKVVPIQAGLGGGSADAMATLRALESLWGLSLDSAALERLGARLGADVAFFARGGTALGTGRGDRLASLPDVPDHHVVIAQPAFGVSTAAAYRWLTEARAGAEAPAATFDSWPVRSEDWELRLRATANDFEAVVVRHHPEIRTGLEVLAGAGAALALMSGSGSAIAGLFRVEGDARAAAVRFDALPGWRVWLSQTVGRAAYQAAVAPITRAP